MTAPLSVKAALEKAFSTEEAFGVYFQNTEDSSDVLTAKAFDHLKGSAPDNVDRVSLLADGSSAVCCTNYACFIGIVLGFDRVSVRGFANEDNPDCLVVTYDLHPGGHDFALVDERYLVDPWVKFLRGLPWQVVYDLHDPRDAELVHERYGEVSAWQVLTRAMELSQNSQLQSPVQVARVTLSSAASQGTVVWSGLCSDEKMAAHLAQRELQAMTGVVHSPERVEMFSLSDLDEGVPAPESATVA